MEFALAKQLKLFTSNDGQATGILAETKGGKVSFALKNKELSGFISLLLEQSEKVAKAKIASTIPSGRSGRQAMTLSPVQSSGVGIGKGRTESERVLQVEVGNLTLAFWVDASVLRGLCKDVERLNELDNLNDRTKRFFLQVSHHTTSLPRSRCAHLDSHTGTNPATQGRPRSADSVAAGEIESWREARRLCCSKDRRLSQGLAQEIKEAAQGKTLSCS